MTQDVIHLSTDALVQAINDEYAVILASERTNLAKALAIGQKLVALKSRTEHGEWKPKLKEYRLTISYETAAVYMRVWNKQAEWRKAAADKNVDPASLTIEEVLKLLRPPPDPNKGKPKPPTAVVKGGVQEPGMEPQSGSLPPDQVVKNLELDYGDMFETLKRKYDQDERLELTKLLAADLGMKLMPLANSDALEALLKMAEPTLAPG